VVLLKDESDELPVELGPLFRLELVDRMARKVVEAGPARVQHAHDAQQRGFTGPARPHDGDEFAFFDGQIDLAKHPGPGRAGLVEFLDVLELDHDGSLSDANAKTLRR
jgi:hypothetical protein